jgi:hypothetical protein
VFLQMSTNQWLLWIDAVAFVRNNHNIILNTLQHWHMTLNYIQIWFCSNSTISIPPTRRQESLANSTWTLVQPFINLFINFFFVPNLTKLTSHVLDRLADQKQYIYIHTNCFDDIWSLTNLHKVTHVDSTKNSLFVYLLWATRII